MKHARKDYDRIQDPLNLIPVSEPVFLLRGQDVCAVDMLAHYCNLLQKKGVIPEQTFSAAQHPLVTSIQNHIELVRQWQRNVALKNPDMLNDADTALLIEKYMASKSSYDLELDSYKESDGNLRASLRNLETNLGETHVQLAKALQHAKDATLERNNMQQDVATMQQMLRHVVRLESIEDVKQYLADYGRHTPSESADINREQLGKPAQGL